MRGCGCVVQSLSGRHVIASGLYLYKREGERKKRREIRLDVIDGANVEMSVPSGDKISGRVRGSIGYFSIYSFL